MDKSINICLCTTPKDVTATLEELAGLSNQSVAHALKAQIQVIKCISAPPLHGSTFDLFFKHIKGAISYADEEYANEIKDRAALLLNNFVFFMKAKVEYEIAANRTEYENLLVDASYDLAESILSLTEVAAKCTEISAGNITTLAPTAKNVRQFAKVFIGSKGDNDGWLQKGLRLAFKNKHTKDAQRNFCDTLHRLSEKLCSNYDVIGRNNIIAGLFQNYRDDLLEYHYSKDCSDLKKKASRLKYKIWIFPLTILGVGCGVSLLVWLVRWIISWFYVPSQGWAVQQCIWSGIIVGGGAILSMLICLIKRLIVLKKIKLVQHKIVNYYDSLIERYTE